MDKRRPTPQQQAVIDCKEGNLLLSASAGSGKTTTVIDRAVGLLLRGEKLNSMVICTFTRAAAADMKDKLCGKLFEYAQLPGFERLNDCILQLPTAEICTIHSWCQRLLRLYFYAIGLDPAFETLEEAEAGMMLDEAIETVIAEAVENGGEAFLFLYDSLLVRRRHRRLAGLIHKLYAYAATQPYPEVWLSEGAFYGYTRADEVRESLCRRERAAAARFCRALTALMTDYAAAGLTRCLPAMKALLCAIEDAAASFDSIPAPSGRIDDIALNERFAALKAEAVKKLSALRSDIALSSGQESEPLARELSALTLAVFTAYRQAKNRKNKVDYNDLEHMTRQLLDLPDIAEEIASRYRWVFVDEYQDINPLQDGIIGAVSRRSNVLVVGDLKQSIYAFRGCEPKIFADKYSRPDAYGFLPAVELNQNFRSKCAILEFANRVFDRAMTRDFGGVDYREKARLTGGKAGGSVRVRLLTGGGENREISGVYSARRDTGFDQTDKEQAACDAMVQDIVALLESGEYTGDGESRPVRPGDIAVLTRSVNGKLCAALYARLKQLNIPVYLKRDSVFSALPETAALLSLITLIDNRTDDVALTGVLLSALVGLTISDLSQIRYHFPYQRAADPLDEPGSFYAAAQRYAEQNSGEAARRLRRFFLELDELCSLSRVLSAGELIGQYLAKKQYFGAVYARKGGTQKSAALSAFLEHLNTVSAGGTIGMYAAYLQRVDPGYSGEAPPDALKIMTIHASKGLEFPFVFLAGATKRFNLSDRNEPFILDRTNGLCLKSWNAATHTIDRNRLFAAAAHRLTERQKEEEMRLLYVALTRPKEALFVYGSVTDKTVEKLKEGRFVEPDEADSFFDWLAPVLTPDEYRIITEEDALIDSAGKEPEPDPVSPPDPVLTALIKERLSFPKTPAGYEVKTSVTAILRDEAAETESAYTCGGEADDRAAQRGTDYHRVMELLDFSMEYSDALRAAIAAGAPADAVNLREIEAAFTAVKVKIAGGNVYKEQSFILHNGGVLVQGIIDVLIVSGKNCTIIDYKTSNPSTIAGGAYDLQLQLYARAAREILGLTVVDAFIYCFSSQRFYPVPL